jgi:hypothetical protein
MFVSRMKAGTIEVGRLETAKNALAPRALTYKCQFGSLPIGDNSCN